MLTQLTIQNFGLIDKLSLEFSRGLNILTGETGAGKSIIIDGLRYALGERLNSSQVRDQTAPCIVEAVFELTGAVAAASPSSKELAAGEDRLTIHRAWLPDGKSRIKINGFSVTVSQLKELGDGLLDFHGPNDHQMLLSSANHLSILDRLARDEKLREEYAGLYAAYAGLLKERAKLEELSSAKQRDIELYSHQIKELEQAPLDERVYAETREKQDRLNNVEKLHECCRAVLDCLENDQTGLSQSIDPCFPHLRQLAKTDPSAETFLEALSGIQERCGEFTQKLTHYLESLSFDGEEAQRIQRLCDAYDTILRKYGPGLEDAKRFYAEVKEKYAAIVNYEENSEELRKKIAEAAAAATVCAEKLRRKRQEAGRELKKTIERELTELGFNHVEFECRLEKTALAPEGMDDAVFYISPNAGEPLKPLAEIVSSGEAARLMLALKKALIGVDPVPVLVFDEIDAQIGGRLGTVTGKKLKELACARQVVVITHLPQIASFADTHFKVCKKVAGNHTLVAVEQLDANQSVKEIAKMMSGEKESDIAVTHAREMRAKARK